MLDSLPALHFSARLAYASRLTANVANSWSGELLLLDYSPSLFAHSSAATPLDLEAVVGKAAQLKLNCKLTSIAESLQ